MSARTGLIMIAVVVSILALIAVLWWLSPASRYQMVLNPKGPLVENGVAVIVACGEKRDFLFLKAAQNVPEPPRVTWSSEERRGGCTVYYHHPTSSGD
jgi:hypothetical protein